MNELAYQAIAGSMASISASLQLRTIAVLSHKNDATQPDQALLASGKSRCNAPRRKSSCKEVQNEKSIALNPIRWGEAMWLESHEKSQIGIGACHIEMQKYCDLAGVFRLPQS